MKAVLNRLKETKSGVTILEIIAVIMIISLFTLLSMPFISKFTRNVHLQNSSRVLSSMLNLARTLSVTQNNNYKVVFDLDNETVEIQDATTNALYDKTWRAPTVINLVDRDGTTTTGTAEIEFTPKGASASGMSHTIHIMKINTTITDYSDADQRGKCYSLVIASTTGHVTIYPYGINNPWPVTTM